jgi:hypothetical protein
VILWDHGGSWRYGFGGDTQNGTRQGPGMTIDDVAHALRAGLEGAGVTDERPLDVLSFDACLMGGLESAWVYRDLAEVYIAAAEIDFKLAMGKAREVMVQVFYALGSNHPLANEYRGKLTRLLY